MQRRDLTPENPLVDEIAWNAQAMHDLTASELELGDQYLRSIAVGALQVLVACLAAVVTWLASLPITTSLGALVLPDMDGEGGLGILVGVLAATIAAIGALAFVLHFRWAGE